MPRALAVISGKFFFEQDVFTAVDGVLLDLKKTGDLEPATDALNVLDKIGDIAGKAKAKLLFGMADWWFKTGQDKEREESFEVYIGGTTENKATVIDRYVNYWKHHEELPRDVQDRPLRDLLPITQTLEQDYSISKSDWSRISKATNVEIGDILREIKGKPLRKNGTRKYWEKDGSLALWKNNRKYFLGFLDLEGYQNDETVRHEIDKILRDARITKR